jgi:hypothetical protein
MQTQQRRLLVGIAITIAALGIAYWAMRPANFTDWALFKGLALILIMAFTELARVSYRKRKGRQ